MALMIKDIHVNVHASELDQKVVISGVKDIKIDGAVHDLKDGQVNIFPSKGFLLESVGNLCVISNDKVQAIKYIKDIRNGIFERNVPAINKGRIADKLWNDGTFSYGMEYGAILATMQLLT